MNVNEILTVGMKASVLTELLNTLQKTGVHENKMICYHQNSGKFFFMQSNEHSISTIAHGTYEEVYNWLNREYQEIVTIQKTELMHYYVNIAIKHEEQAKASNTAMGMVMHLRLGNTMREIAKDISLSTNGSYINKLHHDTFDE